MNRTIEAFASKLPIIGSRVNERREKRIADGMVSEALRAEAQKRAEARTANSGLAMNLRKALDDDFIVFQEKTRNDQGKTVVSPKFPLANRLEVGLLDVDIEDPTIAPTRQTIYTKLKVGDQEASLALPPIEAKYPGPDVKDAFGQIPNDPDTVTKILLTANTYRRTRRKKYYFSDADRALTVER